MGTRAVRRGAVARVGTLVSRMAHLGTDEWGMAVWEGHIFGHVA